jgi:hypothetical protein
VIRTLLALLTVLVLCACTSNSGPTLPDADFYVNAGQAFPLQVGQTVGAVLSTNAFVLVRFSGVSQDSRCPADVTCVQAGSATVQLSVQTTLDVQEIEIEVPPTGEAQQEVAEVTVVVLGLQPAAQSGVTINPLDYVVGLRVDETGSIPLPQ